MTRAFSYEQWFTADDLADRVASTSFVAALPPVEREELLVRVRALVARPARAVPVPLQDGRSHRPSNEGSRLERGGYLERGMALPAALSYNETQGSGRWQRRPFGRERARTGGAPEES